MAREGKLSGLKVLIVEDEALVAMHIEDTLRDLGCQPVAIAATRAEALRQVKRFAFDAVLLDINLNGEESFPVAEQLLSRRIPFIFSTGYSAATIPARLASAPALQKPFLAADLAAALSRALAASE